jgi:uncharacterized protein (DUF433 family)
MSFEHISYDPAILSGKPCIKGTRISVDFILQLVASGATVAEIVARYDHLTEEAVKEAILYASEVLKNEVIIEFKSVA